ncbi:hypothetical protein [endosymbiont 'TC1' of Trimyema compressum]|uniref:hypothetical protein n=1 Tax=endosymbiont 'TC1' of Trimyema compressum TaxID=243899 RepID=UPI001FE05E05|nr:hypothetical protein [endosymbiont 'TC1' of Trimyema compressum]
MAQSFGEIDFKDKETTFAAFITIIMMLLTFSIAKGIAFGFIVYGFLMLASGRVKEIPVLNICIRHSFYFNIGFKLEIERLLIALKQSNIFEYDYLSVI